MVKVCNERLLGRLHDVAGGPMALHVQDVVAYEIGCLSQPGYATAFGWSNTGWRYKRDF